MDADRDEATGGAGEEGILFEDQAAVYLEYSRANHTASTHRTRRDLVEKKLVPWFCGRRLEELRAVDVERMLASHGGLSPASRNRILSALSALLTHAMRLGSVRRNVAASVPRARERMCALPLMTLAEQSRLLDALPAARRLLFLTALDTGARLGALLRLVWGDVDWERGGLLLRSTKSGRPRMVRTSRRLACALRAAKVVASAEATGGPEETVAGEAVAGVRIFEAAVGADGGLRWAWRQSFRRAAAEVGHLGLRVHDLRHLAAINLVRAGVDLPTVQAHLGHRHLVSTLRYAAYADETASGRAARVLDRLHGERSP